MTHDYVLLQDNVTKHPLHIIMYTCTFVWFNNVLQCYFIKMVMMFLFNNIVYYVNQYVNYMVNNMIELHLCTDIYVCAKM